MRIYWCIHRAVGNLKRIALKTKQKQIVVTQTDLHPHSAAVVFRLMKMDDFIFFNSAKLSGKLVVIVENTDRDRETREGFRIDRRSVQPLCRDIDTWFTAAALWFC